LAEKKRGRGAVEDIRKKKGGEFGVKVKLEKPRRGEGSTSPKQTARCCVGWCMTGLQGLLKMGGGAGGHGRTGGVTGGGGLWVGTVCVVHRGHGEGGGWV